ncbi:FAD-dependent oxidoreductase [Amycolatopsis sp. WAC 01375]|uniref:FAD-dependent oxidoreductase n=1 Tax=Amycolatopsis sp. WAC 01375 TaxID=2203194 RepID=UPI001315059E|nr:FAD-dependent oxidoreductase [Amycolatopsis sp. WAC 01375]
MPDAPTVVVVGAGIVGASIAHSLVQRGWSVTVVEQYTPGHVRGSSHDTSRVLRLSYGGGRDIDVWYTRQAWRARQLWQEIGVEEGIELFHNVGVVWFAKGEAEFEEQSARSLEALGLPVERLAPEAARDFFPDVRCDDLEFVLHEPSSGVLRARLGVLTLMRRALRAGARLRIAKARPDAKGRAIVDGKVLPADQTIWACGPWLGRWFPHLAEIESVRQNVFYFGVEPQWRTPGLPVWVDGGAYGAGDIDDSGFKVGGALGAAPVIDPDLADRPPDSEAEQAARWALANRFPALAGAPLVSRHVCQYELTADQHFLLTPVPESVGGWLAGGGGHAFKFGPAFGEYTADLIEGGEQPLPEFGLGPREKYQSKESTTPGQLARQHR